MESSPAPLSLDGLLIHAEWVRNLARALVRDDESASDVEQEVWREAIERPPKNSTNVRGWLAQVARNAARTQARSSRRTREREVAAARPEALPSTLDVVAEAELSRSLAGRVIALAEPYRTTLLLRFFRAQTVDEIAEQGQVSRETVRTRLRRGLELLRADMDAAHEGRAKWMEALLPLARFPRGPAAASTSIWIGGTVGLLTWVGAGAAVVAVAWYAWPTGSKDLQLATHMEVSIPAPDSTGVPARNAEGAALGSSRSVARATSPLLPAESAKNTSTIRAILSDWRGAPMAHMEIELRSKRQEDLRERILHASSRSAVEQLDAWRKSPKALDEFIAAHPTSSGLRDVLLGKAPQRPHVFSADDGGVSVDLPTGDWEPELVDERRLLVRGHRNDSGVEMWIVVPCAPIAGTVVDGEGVPLQGVDITAPISLEALPDFAYASHVSNYRSSEGAFSDGSGRFTIDRAPLLPRHRLRLEKSGFETKEVDIPGGGDVDMHVQLERVVEKNPHLRGLVLAADGSRASEALVQLGQDSAVTDDQGRFDLKLTMTRDGAPLTASKKGSQAAILPGVGRSTMISAEDVVLRLGPAPLGISGVVLDMRGQPVANCTVQIVDGTPSGTSVAFVEDLADGHRQIGKSSDAQGHFEIGGLFPHDYHLMARDAKRGLIAWSGPIAAGSKDVVLRNEPSDFGAVEGRVVTRRGVALGDARVAISLPVFHVGDGASSVTYGEVVADEAGRFQLSEVPRANVQVYVSGAGIDSSTLDLPSVRSGVIELIVGLSVRVRLEVADTSIDHVEFLDERGEPVVARCHFQNSESAYHRIPRGKSGFPVFNLSDAAMTAVLRRGKEEVRRTPVEIRRVELLVLSL